MIYCHWALVAQGPSRCTTSNSSQQRVACASASATSCANDARDRGRWEMLFTTMRILQCVCVADDALCWCVTRSDTCASDVITLENAPLLRCVRSRIVWMWMRRGRDAKGASACGSRLRSFEGDASLWSTVQYKFSRRREDKKHMHTRNEHSD